MDEDDFDFNPGSSKLSSLFGAKKTPDSGNSSFLYTAPKQPRTGPTKPEKNDPTSEPAKMEIILTKTCTVFKLENGAYVNEGRCGLAILGNNSLNIHQVILYKSNKDHKCKVRIHSSLVLTVSANNYVSFYDDLQQNWSLMFDSFNDLQQIIQQVTILKFNCGNQGFLVQDLTPGDQSVPFQENSQVEISFECFSIKERNIVDHCSSRHGKPVVIKISTDNQDWEEVLKGCCKNNHRIVMIQNEKKAPCSGLKIPTGSSLLLRVHVLNITDKFAENLDNSIKLPRVESPESYVDSSAEDSSIKARVASITEALSLSPKSHKANLISRMERMGQATLPVKPHIPTTASDSEEDSSVSSLPRPRQTRTKITSSTHTPTVTPRATTVSEQSVLVYQPEQMMQQQVMRSIPVMSSPVISPINDTAMAVFLSESRTQSTELRIGVSKVTDKVDQVLGKLDKLELGKERNRHVTTASMDSDKLVSGIQNIVSENCVLKEKLEEQKTKLESQNERIFQLLELNQKLLEQTNVRGNQADVESRREIEKYKKENSKLLEDSLKTSEIIKNQDEKVKELESLNENIEKQLKKVESEMQDLKIQLEAKNQQVECNEKLVSDLKERVKNDNSEELVEELEQKKKLLQEVTEKNEQLSGMVERSDVKVKELTSEVENYQQSLERARKELLDVKDAINIEVDNWTKKVKQLVEENARLAKARSEPTQSEETSDVVKKVMNTVYKNLVVQFSTSSSYGDKEIRQVLATTIRDVTLEYLERKEPVVVPENEIVQHKIDEEAKELKVEDQTAGKVADEKKVEEPTSTEVPSNDNVWSSSRPPPPPLLDDDEDDDDWIS